MENLEQRKQEAEPIQQLVEYNLNWIKNIKPQTYKIDVNALKNYFKHPSFGEPLNYVNCSLENFDCYNYELKNMVNKLNNYTKGVACFFSNITGSGKTHIAIALGRDYYRKLIYKWIDDNKDVDFGYKEYAQQDFDEYIHFKKPTFFTESDVYKIEYGNINFSFWLKTTALVIIDDIFASKVNEYSRSAIYEIVNTRITNYNLPTIFTSNLFLSDIGKIDERIASRLQSEFTFELKTAKDMR